MRRGRRPIARPPEGVSACSPSGEQHPSSQDHPLRRQSARTHDSADVPSAFVMRHHGVEAWLGRGESVSRRLGGDVGGGLQARRRIGQRSWRLWAKSLVSPPVHQGRGGRSVRRLPSCKRPPEPRCHGAEDASLPSALDRHVGDGALKAPLPHLVTDAARGGHLGTARPQSREALRPRLIRQLKRARS